MRLTFYGAASDVTGSNFLLEADGKKILVDCGLHQGGGDAEEKNYKELPYDPKEIDAVFVTHAHLDHIGRLPLLWKLGFRGKVFSTAPTKELSHYILSDSEHLLGKSAEEKDMEPLYETMDVDGIIGLWETVPYHKDIFVGDLKAVLYNAGHILGSAIVRISAEGKTVAFSGDLGNFPAPIIQDTEMLQSTDYCVVESTYGDRVHENIGKREAELMRAIKDTYSRKGVLLIPAFAMERTQDLLFHLNDLAEHHRIPKLPIFVDSPLAIKITKSFEHYKEYFDPEVQEKIEKGDKIFEFSGLSFANTTEESKAINAVPAPKVIIAGSGMSSGGRIIYHERRYLGGPENIILFVGHQATETMGRAIAGGAATVNIMGEVIPVRCEKRIITGYSAHADQPRLLEWVGSMRGGLKKVFVVHGELSSSTVLADKITNDLSVESVVPAPGDSFELT